VNRELPGKAVARSASQAPVPLRAGPLALLFDDGDLRYIKHGEREVIRRIYAAVRDRNWGTVPFEMTDLRSEIGEDRFRMTYTRTHQKNEIHFVWRAEIAGEPDGSLHFTFDGEAKSTFLRNRIGFCVLHPIPECAGAKCRATYSDGRQQELTFPDLLSAEQPVAGFQDMIGLAHEIQPDLWAELELSGDLFGMEDQRNWIDASFKTFCTPLRIPFPQEIKNGTRVRQEVRLKIVDWRLKIGDYGNRGISPIFNLQLLPSISIQLTTKRRPLPSIGLCMASHGQPLTPNGIEQLSLLRLAHLRHDVKLADPNWAGAFHLACEQAETLKIPLELAIHLPPANGVPDLEKLSKLLRESKPAMARVLLFREGERTLSLASFNFVRRHLYFPGIPVGAGTNADFYELNRFRPPHAEADFVHWSMNPQVHAFDLVSLAETPATIPAQLKSAAAFFPGKPLVVSPITLKPRFNAVATGPETPPQPGELPPQVDARQLSPFGACWTLAVIKYLAQGGVESMTLFETTGWRGVMEQTSGSQLPAKFPSAPNQVFPLFYAIAGINAFSGGEVILSDSSDPLRVQSVALKKNNSVCLWLANMTAETQKVIINECEVGWRHHRLPWERPETWKFQPSAILKNKAVEPEDSGRELELEPYGLHWLEFSKPL
jgi:hypothetical protein